MSKKNNKDVRLEQKETELRKVKMAFQLLSKCSKALMNPADEAHLLNEICKIVVDVGGYRTAWIGFIQEGQRESVRPISYAGYDKKYLEAAGITWKDAASGQGPTALAIRTGEPYIIKNIMTDPHCRPWRDEAAKVGFSSFIALPLVSEARTFGVLNISATEPEAFRPEEVTLLKELAFDLANGIESMRLRAERKKTDEEIKQNTERMKRFIKDTIRAMALTVELRDPYTAGHQKRVSSLAGAMAQEVGLSQEDVLGVQLAGEIHDIGNLNVPAYILAKPSKLTDSEFEIVKTHCRAGFDILKIIEFPWPIAEIVLQHHEMLDGSGYPSGLEGNDILQEARIIVVADVVETMSSHRPYRPAQGTKKALAFISQNKGVLFDPKAVDACVKLFTKKGFKFT